MLLACSTAMSGYGYNILAVCRGEIMLFSDRSLVSFSSTFDRHRRNQLPAPQQLYLAPVGWKTLTQQTLTPYKKSPKSKFVQPYTTQCILMHFIITVSDAGSHSELGVQRSWFNITLPSIECHRILQYDSSRETFKCRWSAKHHSTFLTFAAWL